MSWLRHWKIVLALSGLFLLGAGTGTVVTLKVVKRFIESRTNPDRMSQTLFQEYDRRLHLTPEQIEGLRRSAEGYVQNSRRFRETLKAQTPP